ncbi:transposable element Tcb2 transposase [Trichonephila clavipes]|nr:transposable element Tcb2 transposase [Trichonephila clavipes]
MDPICELRTVQAGGGYAMVWGVCSWRDMGPLMRLDTTLTSDRYINILSDHLHPFMSIVHSDGHWGISAEQCGIPHFQNCYRVALDSSEFRQFRWSPKSSDRNIIEYIWNDFISYAIVLALLFSVHYNKNYKCFS